MSRKYAVKTKGEQMKNNEWKATEEDAGLWGIHDARGGCFGYVFDDGAKVSGTRATRYLALRCWKNAPVTADMIYGEAKSWQAAVALVIRGDKLDAAERKASDFNPAAAYHLGHIHHDGSETPVGVNAFGLVLEDANYDLKPKALAKWWAEIRENMQRNITHGISATTGKAWHYVGLSSCHASDAVAVGFVAADQI